MSKLVGWLLSFAPKAPEAAAALPPVWWAKAEAAWTPDHAKALQTFLASPTGRAVLDRMYAAAVANAREGVKDAMHASHSAGHSAGFFDALEWLVSQARIEFEQHIEISGADADQSATSAQQPSGEAALREHYSP